jgi:uncharacterized protein YjiS (DUF1127 family)
MPPERPLDSFYSTIDEAKDLRARTIRSLLSKLWLLLETWYDRHTIRGQLAKFDERQLKDIGISRVDVLREVRKPFWRA